ncbi:MAG TPA: hypothetical protein VN958_20675 [Chitinophagaceae bacterium]|nr:hypothetical protein [Chitinophagaceae bacterium]
MKVVTPQYLTDENGKKLSVVHAMKHYKRMLEELEDIRFMMK